MGDEKDNMAVVDPNTKVIGEFSFFTIVFETCQLFKAIQIFYSEFEPLYISFYQKVLNILNFKWLEAPL